VTKGGEILSLATPIAVATGGTLTGTLLGERLLLGMPPRRFRILIGVLIGLLGIWLVISPKAG